MTIYVKSKNKVSPKHRKKLKEISVSSDNSNYTHINIIQKRMKSLIAIRYRKRTKTIEGTVVNIIKGDMNFNVTVNLRRQCNETGYKLNPI